MIKAIFGFVLRRLYRIRVTGLEHYKAAGERVLIVANHVSLIDALILAVCLPDKLTFAVNTYVARGWLVRLVSPWVTLFPMDPTNPLSSKSLIRYLQQDNRAVIFPEGRITVTGSLMKIYDGTGFVADKSGAKVLPVRIDGVQYTPFSRLRGRLKTRWFPRITVTLLPPRTLTTDDSLQGRQRRQQAGKALSRLMGEMMFETSNRDRTLYSAILDAMDTHGRKHRILEDIQRRPVSYGRAIVGSFALGRLLEKRTWAQENVGVLLPNMNSTAITFLALQLHGRVPAMLNYTVGASGLLSACDAACINMVISSRRFVRVGKLEELIDSLAQRVKIVYLEDIAAQIGPGAKLLALLQSWFPRYFYRHYSDGAEPSDPAVVLFTSGSEGKPKGVVLSHKNLMSNREQLAARVDFTPQDIIFNALPMFHSFGLTAGTLLPLLSGMKTFLYPSPLHYRIVPELCYDTNATVMFGTNTFLAGYARYAHPYDFYSIRYVFAGAEKLQEENRRVWSEKFGVRIFEGYGATETSPVLAANTPMENRPGTVGCFLPKIEYRLKPVPGITHGGQLLVRGPNVMLGYYLPDNPGQLVPPVTDDGEAGWYDTGDIVEVDADGFVTIKGRVKRFAKIGGEMVSLTLVEELAQHAWPEVRHAAVSVPDAQRGETIVLVTEQSDAERAVLQQAAKTLGVGEINVPRTLLVVGQLPLLGTGKTDYPAIQKLVSRELELVY